MIFDQKKHGINLLYGVLYVFHSIPLAQNFNSQRLTLLNVIYE